MWYQNWSGKNWDNKMKNRILIRHNSRWGLEEKVVVNLAQKALKHWKYPKDTELSLYFVGRKKARGLNVKFRKMDYYPQVLGFPMNKEKDADGFVRLGDVVICTQKLKYEAKLFDKEVEAVLGEWLIHGVENLLK